MSITIAFKPHKNPRIDAMTGAQRLRWVLEFIQRNLETLPSEMLEALGDDLQHAAAPWWVEKPQMWKNRQCTDMSAADVRALQQEIRAGVQAVMGESVDITETIMIHSGHAQPHGGWVLPETVTHLLRVHFQRPGRHFCIMRVSEGTSDRTAILTGVANLIVRFGDRLSTCPVCGTPFLRQHRQAYCTVRCSNKVRNRRRLDRKADHRKNGQLMTTLS